jgi:hypothetical protein
MKLPDAEGPVAGRPEMLMPPFIPASEVRVESRAT